MFMKENYNINSNYLYKSIKTMPIKDNCTNKMSILIPTIKLIFSLYLSRVMLYVPKYLPIFSSDMTIKLFLLIEYHKSADPTIC